ncbi:uncharacterized protein (TIGR02231 family) [Chryseobacterium sp. SORGH_AS 447]|uniref:DUF4139 domain-containing protein n=1 Tax=Chryseobacterium sp. SORGH_AS_0447 TaxID=3041769 RepID=UPI00277EEC37|nr:DUF4139 domain-containing protein [Chryseobacterium sp. SORGH_AS_0447]MDQ1161557.1 uncharacterized protein (TIGR02231 family) [Chryseobacterium sp. SORGH_AS_0447]
MKKVIIVALCSISLIAFGQKPVFAEAKLNSVTLYEQSAELYSNSTFKIPKGSSEVVITNIAQNIDESTIKIGSRSKVSVLTYRFTTDENFYKTELDKRNPQHKIVLDSISLMEKKLKDLDFQKTALANSIGILDKNQIINAGSTSYSKELEKLIDYYQKKRTELSIQLDKAETSYSSVAEKLDKLRTKFDLNNQELEKYPKGKLVLQISSEGSEDVNLDIRYSIREALWRPYYDVVIPDINSKAQLLYKAMVRQNSGLDWKNVELHLVSGYPNVKKQIPFLPAWSLLYQEPLAAVDHGVKLDRAENYVSVRSSSVKQVSVAEVALVGSTVSRNQLNVAYDLKDRYTILSNNQDNSINLDRTEIPAIYTYYTIPKIDRTVYLIAELDNLDKYNLINAEANVIFENTNVGKTTLNAENTDSKLLLTLGDDKRISVKREAVKDKTMEKSISSSNKEQQFAYQLTIRNNKSEKVKIRIKDRIPVSQDKQLIITLVNKGGATYNEETGELTWDILLNANETRKLEFSFKVNSLKNRTILGL